MFAFLYAQEHIWLWCSSQGVSFALLLTVSLLCVFITVWSTALPTSVTRNVNLFLPLSFELLQLQLTMLAIKTLAILYSWGKLYMGGCTAVHPCCIDNTTKQFDCLNNLYLYIQAWVLPVCRNMVLWLKCSMHRNIINQIRSSAGKECMGKCMIVKP